MIYDLHTLLHKHTHTRRQQEWSGDDRRGCTRSVPVALDWQDDGSDVGKSKTKGAFIIGKLPSEKKERAKD